MGSRVAASRPTPTRQRARAYATTSGMLLAMAATPVAIAIPPGSSWSRTPAWIQGLALTNAVWLLLASWWLIQKPRSGRVAATVGILGVSAFAAPHLIGLPHAALAALITVTSALALLWEVGAPIIELSRIRRRPLCEGQAQGAGIMGCALWLLWGFTDDSPSTLDAAAVGFGLSTSALFALEWALRYRRAQPVRAAVLSLCLGGALAVTPVLWGRWWWLSGSLVGVALASSLLIRRRRSTHVDQLSVWEPLLGHPERLFVGTFAALCFGGTVLLALPQSAADGTSIGLVDAAFTSTSAVCVTGLATRDTAVDFSGFGQVVILLLIQVGGLGIMTFSTVAMWALGRRLSLRHEGVMASLISTQDRGQLFATAKRIIVMTLVTELGGALLLAIAFVADGDGLGTALFRAAFTAISAFCNAGFALQSDSLVAYQHSPAVLHIIALLIMLGSLSPVALFALPTLMLRAARPVSAQARLGLSTSALLWLVGCGFYLAFEWNDSLAGLSVVDRIHNAWFQSVTLRTAGFNSVDLSVVRPATLTLMLVWMFIGGNPGGTAGGVKTTTIAVLVLSVVQAMRGRWTLEVFGKRVPERTRAKAAVVATVAAATGLLALCTIQLTQGMPTRLAVFEVVSALGTVGLTIGGTGQLDGIGKAVIIVCMFVGRVGGLTLLMFMRSRRSEPLVGRPEEEIDVG